MDAEVSTGNRRVSMISLARRHLKYGRVQPVPQQAALVAVETNRGLRHLGYCPDYAPDTVIELKCS